MNEKHKKLGLTLGERGKLEFNEGVFVDNFIQENPLIRVGSDYHIYENNYWSIKEDIDRFCKSKFDELKKGIWRLSYSNLYMPTLKIETQLIKASEMNRYPYRINFKDKVYDFKVGEFSNHNKENYFNYINNYCIAEEGKETPIFDELLDVASNNRIEIKEYLLEMIASIISGCKSEQKFYIFKGSGRNGKSTIINLIIKLIGERFAESISISKLGDRFALSSAVGKKLLVASENEGSIKKRIPTETLKLLSGKDLVKVESKYEKAYSTYLNLDMIFAINNNIYFAETSEGLRRRLVVIPFDGVIQNIDTTFEARLEKEIPDIMRKLIKVYEKIRARGGKLMESNLVYQATEELILESERGEIDIIDEEIADFFEENLEPKEEASLSKESIYSCYRENGGRQNETQFWIRLRKYFMLNGITTQEKKNKKRFVVGLDFLSNSEDIEEALTDEIEDFDLEA